MTSETKKRIADINKGIIPEGYKKTKVGIVPVEWEIVKLSGIGKNYIGLTYTPEDTANTGLIVLRSSNIKDSKIDLNDCVYVKCEVSEKNRVKHNDILICARNGSSGLIGKSALITEAYSDLAFGAFMSVYRTKYYNYIFQAFQSFIIKKQILRNLGARINQITTADINQFKVPFPPLPEQQKIAEILSAQDKLIELQEKKIEQLKELKKAYLQKMFPKKGSKYPELRFKGFTDPWEQRKFSDFTFAAGERNKDDLDLEPFAITNNQGFIAQSEAHDDFGYMKDVDRKMYIVVKPNSFAYNPARINVGSLGYYEGAENVIVSSLYEVFQTAEYVDDKFLKHWFKTKAFQDWIERLQEGSVRLYFYYDKLCECIMSMPSVEEQRKIGAYLDKIDNLITLHQRKSEQEKQKKKALMQLLLTGKVRCI